MSHYKGFYDLHPRINSNYHNSDLLYQFERDKKNNIDDEMKRNYLNNDIYNKIHGRNIDHYNNMENNRRNEINENSNNLELIEYIKKEKEFFEDLFEKETKKAIEMSLKEEKKRKLEEIRKKEEYLQLDKNQLNDGISERNNKNKIISNSRK